MNQTGKFKSAWLGPLALAAGGLCLGGAWLDPRQFAFSYLAAYLFFLSLSLGALFLVMMHHLFDTQWMVPLRRFWEHLAGLFPIFALLFIPIALNPLLAKGSQLLYSWAAAPSTLFRLPVFYAVSAVILGAWSWLGLSLRRASLAQDVSGAAGAAYYLRRLSAGGMAIYAITVTLGAVYWMQSVDRPWFSSMYGVYYFAGSVWAAIAATYLLALVGQRCGPLRPVLKAAAFHDLGVLLLAFTIFYAYIAFSQYFLVWNANLPEETFWFAKREQGSWSRVGVVLILGHFFLPFLALLPQSAKRSRWLMVPLCAWALAMHFLDLTFNLKPPLNPGGLQWHWLDAAAVLFIGSALAWGFLRLFRAAAPYPLRDPRLAETLAAEAPATLPASQPDECREPWATQTSPDKRAYLPGVGLALGFLLLVALAWNFLPQLNQPAPTAKRAAERAAALADLSARDAKALTTYGWQDQTREIVRLPIQQAIAMMPALWQDPIAGRSNLLLRLQKSLAKPVEKPNPYE